MEICIFCAMQHLPNTEFTKDDIINIQPLNPSKVHGHEMISISMLKIYGDFILDSLYIIFKNSPK